MKVRRVEWFVVLAYMFGVVLAVGLMLLLGTIIWVLIR